MIPYWETKSSNLFVYHFDNFNVPSHFHDGIELIYVAKGSITLLIENSPYDIKEGELSVILPNRVHRYKWDGISVCSGEVIILGNCFFHNYKALYGKTLLYPVFQLSALHPDISFTFMRLLKSEQETSEVQNAYAQLLLCRLIPELSIASLPPLPETDMLQALTEYMSEHFLDPLSLTTVADALHVDKFRLSRLFSLRIHMSFRDYLNHLRVEYAAVLLKTTDKSVTDIAMESGFDSLCTFHRAFRKIYPCSPGAYRKG